MQITTITFRRKVNSGNFESFDVEATATLAPEDQPGSAAAYLQSFVDTVCNDRLDTLRKPGTRAGKDAGEFPFDEPR